MFLVALYYLVFTPLSTWWGNAMEKAGVAGFLVTVFSMLINFVTEFLYQKFVVFRKKAETEHDIKVDHILKIINAKF